MSETKVTAAELARRWHGRTLRPEEVLAASDRVASDPELRNALGDDRYLAAVADAVEQELEMGHGDARHLTTEELEGWVDGRDDRAREHLAACASCRAEAEDLASFAAELRGAGDRRQGRRWALAAAAVLLIAFGLLWTRRTASPPEVSPPPRLVETAPAPAVPVLLRDGPVEIRAAGGDAVVGVPEPWREEIAALLRNPVLQLPAVALAVARAPETRRGAAVTASAPVVLLSPVSEVLLEDRPSFRWRGPAGTTYRVEVYGPRFERVTGSGDLERAEWRPPAALPRRELLTWTVTAVGTDGVATTYPLAPNPPAVFELASREESKAVDDARATGSRLLLGLALWRAGRVEDAAHELDALAHDNPGSKWASDLAASGERAAAALRDAAR